MTLMENNPDIKLKTKDGIEIDLKQYNDNIDAKEAIRAVPRFASISKYSFSDSSNGDSHASVSFISDKECNGRWLTPLTSVDNSSAKERDELDHKECVGKYLVLEKVS